MNASNCGCYDVNIEQVKETQKGSKYFVSKPTIFSYFLFNLQVWFKDPTRMLEDYPEVDVIMSTDCLCSLLDDGDDYFEDVRWSLREEWNSG